MFKRVKELKDRILPAKPNYKEEAEYYHKLAKGWELKYMKLRNALESALKVE